MITVLLGLQKLLALLTWSLMIGSFQRIILELLRVAMVGIPNTKGFIVDGFPREMEQGKEFENEVSTFVS